MWRSLQTASRLRGRALSLRVDPRTLIQGVTAEDVANDPKIEAFLRANFPDAFDTPKEAASPLDVESEAHVKESEPHYALNIRPLTTYIRDSVAEEGTRNVQALRESGFIPGMLRGSNPDLGISSHNETEIYVKTPWKSLQRELDRYQHNFGSRVYGLTVWEHPEATEGYTQRVVPQNVNRHPVNSTIYCANYCRYHAARPLKFPVRKINEEESPALKRDGFIIPITRKIECFVEDGATIPEALDLECSGLQFKDVIRTDRLILPEGVRLSDRMVKRGRDLIVGVMFGRSRDAAAAASTEAGEEEKE